MALRRSRKRKWLSGDSCRHGNEQWCSIKCWTLWRTEKLLPPSGNPIPIVQPVAQSPCQLSYPAINTSYSQIANSNKTALYWECETTELERMYIARSTYSEADGCTRVQVMGEALTLGTHTPSRRAAFPKDCAARITHAPFLLIILLPSVLLT
jgi:hypothetical protein